MVTIARAHPYSSGFYTFCNTRAGTLNLVDFIDGTNQKLDVKEQWDCFL
jgi:hypothetical protein